MVYRCFSAGLIFLVFLQVSCVPVEEVKPAKDRAEYHYLLGSSALAEQEPTEALKEFLQAVELDPDDPRIHTGLAQAYWHKQAFELAEKHFVKAIELSDGTPQLHNNLGALYLSMKRYDDAIKSFRQAAENLLFDRPEVAWAGVGYANFMKQDYKSAQQAYEKSMSLNPRYYRAPFRLGELYYNQGRPVEALKMFARAIELAPSFAEGYYWQGLVYMKMKDTAKAQEAFREVVRLTPQSELAFEANNYLKIIGE